MISKLKHIILSLKTFKLPVYVLIRQNIAKAFAKPFDSSQILGQQDITFSSFQSQYKAKALSLSPSFEQALEWHIEKWLSHSFDLLGSGWISRNTDAEPVGYMGFKVPKIEKQKVEHRGVYIPIDWHIDIKSGYVWNKDQYSDSIDGFLKLPYGVDIKVPWELARLNHLPLLTYSTILFPGREKEIADEFKYLILDFIQNNPYQKGVNWMNAMEVGIRMVNILLAGDYILQSESGKEIFDADFQAKWEICIYEHIRYILEHSEYKNGLTNNHYYANISALLFAGSYFKNSKGGKNLLSLAFEEVLVESEKQFLKDGGNFESSTHYHRLSTEMLLWNILGAERHLESLNSTIAKAFAWNNYKSYSEKSGSEKIKRLKSIAGGAIQFSESITKPNGNITAMGDQDSGRFIKLNLSGEFKCFEELKALHKQIELGDYKEDPKAIWWVENDLDQRFIQIPIKEENSGLAELFPIEFDLFSMMDIPETKTEIKNQFKSNTKSKLPFTKLSKIDFENSFKIHPESVNWTSFEDFGIYIARCEGFMLSVSASNNHLAKYWSHGKNDKLSFELFVNGEDKIVDPGSFIYSPDVEMRNKFRAGSSHSTISVEGEEQNRWPEGKHSVFNLYNESNCSLISLKQDEIVLFCSYRDVKHQRTFRIRQDHIEILDECNKEFKTHFNTFKLYSNHYGRWINQEKRS